MVSFYANSSVVLELWRVEVDRTDFNGDFKHKAERRSAVVTRCTVFLHFLINDLQPLFYGFMDFMEQASDQIPVVLGILCTLVKMVFIKNFHCNGFYFDSDLFVIFS